MTTSVLFVCLGNICRSPTAHGVFRDKVKAKGLSEQITIDSAGTSAGHLDAPPDKRARAAAKSRGYDLSKLKARRLSVDDFANYDYILGMDLDNVAAIEELKPAGYQGHTGLFLEFSTAQFKEVPDPYYGGTKGFELVLDLVEAGADDLLEHIRKA